MYARLVPAPGLVYEAGLRRKSSRARTYDLGAPCLNLHKLGKWKATAKPPRKLALLLAAAIMNVAMEHSSEAAEADGTAGNRDRNPDRWAADEQPTASIHVALPSLHGQCKILKGLIVVGHYDTQRSLG